MGRKGNSSGSSGEKSANRTPRSYLRRHLLALFRLAIYALVCGVFFEIGVHVGKLENDFSVWPNVSVLQSFLKRAADAAEDEELEAEWKDQSGNDQILGILPIPNVMNPGEMGKPVKLPKLSEEQKKMVKEGWKNNGFNQYVSDLISVNRSLPDIRHPR